jgi:hypothetical protein
MMNKLGKLIIILSISIIILYGCSKDEPEKPENPFLNVLIETFTNVQCSTCVEVKNTVDSVLRYYQSIDDLKTPIWIDYHPPITGIDPFFKSNPNIHQTRANDYSYTGDLPKLFIDGHEIPQPDYYNPTYLISYIDSLVNFGKPGEIEMEITTITDTIEVSGIISTNDTVQGQIYSYLLREEVTFTTAPGASGETVFKYVAAEIKPDLGGEFISIRESRTFEFTYIFTTPSEIELGVTKDYTVVVFVQNNEKKILAAKALNVDWQN